MHDLKIDERNLLGNARVELTWNIEWAGNSRNYIQAEIAWKKTQVELTWNIIRVEIAQNNARAEVYWNKTQVEITRDNERVEITWNEERAQYARNAEAELASGFTQWNYLRNL